jgi:plastocyanin
MLLSGLVQAATLSVTVNDAAGKPVPEAVVFVMPASGRPPAGAPRPAVVEQVNREFVPFVVPVQVGASVSFPNRDTIRHHVFSFSPAKVFDLKLYTGVPANPVVFDKPGPVVLGCNIHDWMVGFVYAVETPWFGRTAGNGGTAIELPAGEYEVRVWHPWQRGDVARERVKVDAAAGRATVRIDLAPPASAQRR